MPKPKYVQESFSYKKKKFRYLGKRSKKYIGTAVILCHSYCPSRAEPFGRLFSPPTIPTKFPCHATLDMWTQKLYTAHHGHGPLSLATFFFYITIKSLALERRGQSILMAA